MLHEDGVDLNGVTLQSSDPRLSGRLGNRWGCCRPAPPMPGITADGRRRRPTDLGAFMDAGDPVLAGAAYREGAAAFPKADPRRSALRAEYLGHADIDVLDGLVLNVADGRSLAAPRLPDHAAEGQGLGAGRL